MPLTQDQQIQNARFFERVFQQLNENGIWQGDDGIMKKKTMPGLGWATFLAEHDTYIAIKNLTPSWWFNKRVTLWADLSK